MQFDASLLVPTFRRTGHLVAAMPATAVVAWLLVGALYLLTDIGLERWPGFVTWALLMAQGVALTFVQVWVTRDALNHLGFRPVLPIVAALGVLLQGILIALGVALGLLLLILPGLYVAARWYLAGTLLIAHGGGRRAAMQRSWDMLASHWPTPLAIGLVFGMIGAAPILLSFYPLPFVAEGSFAALLIVNMISAIGNVGGFLAAAALLSLIEPATEELKEIFG